MNPIMNDPMFREDLTKFLILRMERMCKLGKITREKADENISKYESGKITDGIVHISTTDTFKLESD